MMVLIIMMFLIVITPAITFSAPNINLASGTFSDGQQITITGNNFGDSGPNILLFDNFASAINGQRLPTAAVIGQWSLMPSYGFSDLKLSNGKGARTVSESGWLNANVILFGNTYSEVFVTSIGYVPIGYRFPYATAVRNMPSLSALKHHWLYYSSNGYASNNYPDIFTPNWTGGEWYLVSSNDNFRGTYDTTSESQWAWDEPIRWAIWIKGNGTSVLGSDGFFQAVSSIGQTYQRYKDYKAWFSSTDVVYGFDRMTVVGWLRDPCSYPTDNYVIDDVYVAVGPNAAARVEIGNSSNYYMSTKIAINTIVNWTNTRIVFTMREGTFKPSENAYLFVVDGNGIASQGYPIMITGSNVTIPNPPTGLRVQ